MNWNDLPPEVVKLVAAPTGAITALVFLREPWPKRVAMALLSVPTSWFASSTVASFLHIPEGFAGWLIAVFGIIIVRGIFESFYTIKWAATIEEFVRARLKLPPKPPVGE
jgi:uncharacterized membrane protein YccC